MRKDAFNRVSKQASAFWTMPDKPWNVEPYVTQERIRTIHYGIGAIGAEVVRQLEDVQGIPA